MPHVQLACLWPPPGEDVELNLSLSRVQGEAEGLPRLDWSWE